MDEHPTRDKPGHRERYPERDANLAPFTRHHNGKIRLGCGRGLRAPLSPFQQCMSSLCPHPADRWEVRRAPIGPGLWPGRPGRRHRARSAIHARAEKEGQPIWRVNGTRAWCSSVDCHDAVDSRVHGSGGGRAAPTIYVVGRLAGGILMHAQNDNTAPEGLRGWWTSPPRSGMRRIISPWEYRHLRAWAGMRIASGVVLVGLGVVTLSFGGNDRKTYGWTTVFLASAAAHLAFASWELSIARSTSARS